jgi:hypothetical protein
MSIVDPLLNLLKTLHLEVQFEGKFFSVIFNQVVQFSINLDRETP